MQAAASTNLPEKKSKENFKNYVLDTNNEIMRREKYMSI
jgi:hypothetical protein